MKQFKELTISGGNEIELKKVLKEIANDLPDKWILKNDLIETYTQNTSKGKDEVICVQSPPIKNKIGLIWFGISRSLLKVYNIVPIEVGSLNHDEYNDLIDAFNTNCISPVVNNPNLKVNISSDSIKIQDEASLTTVNLLEDWESNCNHSTGNTNPHDFKRWIDFVIESHKSDSQLSSETLQRWLTEERGWNNNDDLIYKIITDYEYALDILTAYDRTK